MQSYDTLIEKWAPVLNEESAGKITDPHRRAVTAAILENQEKAIAEERSASRGFMTENAASGANNTGSVNNFDPVLISLVRRAMPPCDEIVNVSAFQVPRGLTKLFFCVVTCSVLRLSNVK